jgi:predicted acylesterase/phospholipase RssA
LLGWLDGAERDHRFVVYRADAKDTEWTRRCVRQADRVFLVGSAGGDGAVGRAEVAAQETRAQVELVLLHRDYSSPPTGTAAWLESRAVAAHHHVSLDGCDDFDRLARRLAGRSVGVVLGGGGARGMVHLGVMKALEEAGMPVDAIGGTSIGAILGAGWAQGWDHEARLEKAVCAFVRTRRLVGFTFPAVALSSGKKISQLLRAEDHLGERRIEDLWRPFFCVSANLSTAQAVVHDRGPTWWAVRASASLPGVLPPVCDGHEVLVDGGVVENLPVDIMRARLEGAVIAVDVGREVDLRVAEPFDPTLSGWRVLGRRLNPFRPRLDVPTLVDVMLRSREVGARRAQRDALAARPPELLLRPPTEACDTLDFRQGCELIDAGYRYTLHQLERSSTAQSLINGAHAL